ncbi:folylpolyglutamate synthase/dihydrofolate synthase family protein [Opitutus sp. ER46]|uniref:bifunctional folylpolyglutamate synthase/dihydrofolate synthase n=1 Tax=Opitutus sp. ER46 TaxID=2161864 RepID=UPI000D3053EB|nr:folylpolyglutamate synthase/dihydrofolate synthase family protein [Opitutus sp. ER46]PTX92688.1 bifunctional folylpolyglutamate synthase/dihydrofolate synthase [Opitutus sp. ER46]
MSTPEPPLDADTRRYLHGLKQRGVALGLERMQAFLAAAGGLPRDLPMIHVAGTNGKGSVAAMLEAILRHAGWHTGLYTSPHLVRLGERVQVDRRPLGAAELARLVDELRPTVDALVAPGGVSAGPSYFEFMTGLALRHFAQARCDIALVEVGMGGRLDATNLVMPEVSVITSIGLDHCDFLGTTLAAIAREKAGIIKPGRPVVIGRLPAEAEEAVRLVARAQGAPVGSVAAEFGPDLATYPTTNLPGNYQRVNAATATLAARQLPARWRLTPEVIAAALLQVDWPGRWQTLQVGGRRVLIDTSHNAEGAQVLDANLAELRRETGHRPVVVTGVLGAARARPLLEVLGRHASALHLVVPAQSRACGFEALEALLPAEWRGRAVRDEIARIFPAPGLCLSGVPLEVPLVVTGSIYLAGEVLARLEPQRGPLESDLQDF